MHCTYTAPLPIERSLGLGVTMTDTGVGFEPATLHLSEHVIKISV